MMLRLEFFFFFLQITSSQRKPVMTNEQIMHKMSFFVYRERHNVIIDKLSTASEKYNLED